LLFPAPIQGYYGVLGALQTGAYYLANGLLVGRSLTVMGGTAVPPAGGRNVAAVAPLDASNYVALTTPVRSSITAAVTGDARTTLQMINATTLNQTLLGVVPENPVINVFSPSRANTAPRQLVVNSAGTTAYAITLSGLSVISMVPSGNNSAPSINASRGIVNSTDGTTANIRPGSFITITGKNLASPATADTIPPPTVLGGSCVTFGDIAIPLLSTADGQILAQVPTNLLPGTQVVQVRSLATAQDSAPVMISVRSTTGTAPIPQAGGKRRFGGGR
jgi:hypothetical protein